MIPFLKTPDFWSESLQNTQKKSWVWRVTMGGLKAVGWIYHSVTQARLKNGIPAPMPSHIKTICVGNIRVGGSGKTPVCLWLLEQLKIMPVTSLYLGHGYGGRSKNMVLVHPDSIFQNKDEVTPFRAKSHKTVVEMDTGSCRYVSYTTAIDVGDEAALVASKGYGTLIAKNRVQALRYLADALPNRAPSCLVVVDDGFQNPHLPKTLSILVFDGASGLGNGQILPAGALREPLETAVPRAELVIILGEDKHNLQQKILKIRPALPIFHAALIPASPKTVLPDATAKVIAFAGVADPMRVFASWKAAGYTIAASKAFADHHVFTIEDLKDLKRLASEHNAVLVTTEKDWVRLPADFSTHVHAIPVALSFPDMAAEKVLLNFLQNLL